MPRDLNGDKDSWDEDTRDHSTTHQHETNTRSRREMSHVQRGVMGQTTARDHHNDISRLDLVLQSRAGVSCCGLVCLHPTRLYLRSDLAAWTRAVTKRSILALKPRVKHPRIVTFIGKANAFRWWARKRCRSV
ncbi:hypothetical protein E2C01_100721 [Portunus trituberculatus]|uniref:Uncharacterized protein n=1 Tax=Portunus trituberculatus TaxID=210409 RepID=A0A5B7KE17_PORTR|nr:hypothetical protein [Portunus trituberculatus]